MKTPLKQHHWKRMKARKLSNLNVIRFNILLFVIFFPSLHISYWFSSSYLLLKKLQKIFIILSASGLETSPKREMRDGKSSALKWFTVERLGEEVKSYLSASLWTRCKRFMKRRENFCRPRGKKKSCFIKDILLLRRISRILIRFPMACFSSSTSMQFAAILFSPYRRGDAVEAIKKAPEFLGLLRSSRLIGDGK